MRKTVISLQQYDQSPQNLDDHVERVSQVRCRLKSFFLKMQDGGRPICLRNPFCMIMKYCHLSIFKMAGIHHLGILKMKFLTANHFKDMFCIITLNFVEISRTAAEISHFCVQLKRKNSLETH